MLLYSSVFCSSPLLCVLEQQKLAHECSSLANVHTDQQAYYYYRKDVRLGDYRIKENEQVGQYRKRLKRDMKLDLDLDPLTLKDRSGRTGMHLAIKMHKVERALILLKETAGN